MAYHHNSVDKQFDGNTPGDDQDDGLEFGLAEFLQGNNPGEVEENQVPQDAPSDATGKLNNNKYCQFCHTYFQQTGSLGRHLDRKRGDNLHPLEDIDKIRNNVNRRKIKSVPSDEDLVKQVNKRIKKQDAAKRYNLKEDVRERNKLRRRTRDRQIKAKLSIYQEFLNRFGKGVIPESTFPQFVCMHLPVIQWPQDPPDVTMMKILRDKITDPVVEDKIVASFEQWNHISLDMKLTIWLSTQKQCLHQALGDVTLHEVINRNADFKLREETLIEEYSKEDFNLDSYDFNDINDLDDTSMNINTNTI